MSQVGVITAIIKPLLDILFPVVITIVGWYLANNYRRGTRVKLIDTRRDAYGKLWEITQITRGSRNIEGLPGNPNPLSLLELHNLRNALLDWYWTDGNGMLLEPETVHILLNAANNMVRDSETTKPPLKLFYPVVPNCLDGTPENVLARSDMALIQTALLRTALKAEMSISSRLTMDKLGPKQVAFLRASGVNLRKSPWRQGRKLS